MTSSIAMDDIAPPPENFQEMMTPRNLVLYVIIREYFHMQHLLMDPTIALKDRENGLHDANHKYLFYLHLLEMLDDEHVDPLASVRAGAESPLRKFLAKLVMMKLREFIPAHIQFSSDARGSAFLSQLNSGILSLQFYLAPETLTRLLSPSRRMYNYDELTFAKNSVFGLFMRRVNLAFNSMPFEKSMLFMDRLTQYLMSGTDEEYISIDLHDLQMRTALRNEAQELGGFLDEFDGTHAQADVPDDEVAPFTQEQARDFVREQVRLLHVCPNGALPPVEMSRKLGNYCRRFPFMSELSYLKYLNALRTRDVCAAEHALHHFVALKASDLASGEASDSLYTYAALCAANLHKQLGHDRLAREAEQEALDKALLAKDGNLLVLMRSIHPLLNEEEKCPVLGEIDGNNSVVAQAERKELSVIDLRHSIHDMHRSGSRPSELLLHFYLSLTPDMAESTHTLDMELANLWDSYGFPLIADVFGQCCLLYDPSRAHQHTLVDEAVVQSLCRQLRRLEVLPCPSSVLLRSQHLFALLDRHVIHLPHRRLVSQVRAELNFSQAWLEGRTDAAGRWVDALGLVAPREASLRWAHLLRARGDRQEAHRLLQKLLGADDGLSGLRARLLLAEMALEADAGHLLALHAGVCRGEAKRRWSLAVEAWVAFLEAARACGKGEVEEAGRKMGECKASLLANGGRFDWGRVHFLDGMIRMRRWQEAKEEETRKKDLDDALRLFNEALSNFELAHAVKRVRSTAAVLALIHQRRLDDATTAEEQETLRGLRNKFAEMAVTTEDRPDDSPEFDIVCY